MSSKVRLTVLVAALGYFVDIYDLQLFNIIGKASLRGLGIQDPALLDYWDYQLFNWQMGGMLCGGLIWGILGDKKGRRSILFGSILLYSFANLANAFVVNTDQYCIIRFLAGLGLAGELGAAITLVSEVMDKEKRGYGTMLIVTMGALGAVAAALISQSTIELFGLAAWQMAYIIGGTLGLLLLALRVSTFESGMFDEVKKTNVSKGNFFMLFHSRKRLLRYLSCIALGLPVWFCIGILIKHSEKFATANQVSGGPINTGIAIVWAYMGLSFGDFLSGIFSQVFRNRKKVVLGYLIATVALFFVFLHSTGYSTTVFYLLTFLVGAVTGYWALFVSIASEQFGTNIRATVTTTVPNFVRGAVIPISLSYKSLAAAYGNTNAAWIVGGICIALSLAALYYLPETFGKDLNFLEGEQ